ncbi:hypothetical protein NQ314_020046 [Rhamnusium bicolor]|uniref:Uncharacterized protein n=1 Tax=Rhamnusium bicolor TaxID=1586634 RepID=A0AAV8WLN0_9CUCU|nr:hypothetical protein NQ314_020046 [Rhamnusium bicolor]
MKREYRKQNQYRFATTWDKFLLSLGLISAIATGIVQPLNTILFGGLTGDIIDYAMVLNDINSTDEEIEEATGIFLDGIRYFAIMNALIGVAMFVFTYISTETFNYSALRQVIIIVVL